MAFERIKALWPGSTSEQRLPADPEGEEFTPPHEVEDPRTFEDGTKTTWREWMGENTTIVISFSLLAFATLILLAVYAGRFFLTILTNPWLHRAVVVITIAGVSYFWGRSAMRSQLQQVDELILYDPDEKRVIPYLGEYHRLQGASHDKFIPYKGYRGLGHSEEEYRVGELSKDLVKQQGLTAESKAEIRLHPEVMAVESTERGRKVTQLCSGIEPDAFGRDGNLEASLPNLAGVETVDEMKDELEKLYEEVSNLRDQVDQLKRQRNEAREEARKVREELRKDIAKTAEIFEPFATRRTGRNDSEDNRQSGNGPSNKEILDTLRNQN